MASRRTPAQIEADRVRVEVNKAAFIEAAMANWRKKFPQHPFVVVSWSVENGTTFCTNASRPGLASMCRELTGWAESRIHQGPETKQ